MKRLLHTLLLLLATLPAAAQLSDRPAEIRREVLSVALPAPDRSMRPVVGISVNEQARNSVRSTYTEAIEQAGGLPVIIPMSQNTDVLAEQLSRIDALVLIGGDDIDPAFWDEPHHERLGDLDTLRDVYDLRLVYLAERLGLPLLGICHGEQIINVAFGGTLWQDLPSQRKAEHRQRAKDSLGYHDVEFAPGSRIARIMGGDRHKTNSFHHQAVRRTADGFRATGISRDGIVEVIEPEDGRPILGVQFHPEISAVKYGDERMRALFDWLLEEARGFAGQKR